MARELARTWIYAHMFRRMYFVKRYSFTSTLPSWTVCKSAVFCLTTVYWSTATIPMPLKVPFPYNVMRLWKTLSAFASKKNAICLWYHQAYSGQRTRQRFLKIAELQCMMNNIPWLRDCLQEIGTGNDDGAGLKAGAAMELLHTRDVQPEQLMLETYLWNRWSGNLSFFG